MIVETALAALAECAWAMPEPAAIRATIGLPLTVAFSGLLGLPEQSPELDVVVQEYRRLWRQHVIPRSPELLYPGVAEGLQILRDLGLRLAVATSKITSGANRSEIQGGVRLLLAVMAASALLLGFSCSTSSLVVDGTVAVLEKPYPPGYPSTNPVPNAVIATLEKGQRVKVKGTGYGKDFMYYEVALPDGRRGYVIYTAGSFHVEK